MTTTAGAGGQRLGLRLKRVEATVRVRNSKEIYCFNQLSNLDPFSGIKYNQICGREAGAEHAAIMGPANIESVAHSFYFMDH